MPKKSIIAILSATVLCMVVGLALVFTVGPKSRAADDNVVELSDWDDFLIDSNGVLRGLSMSGMDKLGSSNFKVIIPEGVKEIYYGIWSGTVVNVFYPYHTRLIAVTFPSTLQSIWPDAFWESIFIAVDLSHTMLSSVSPDAFGQCSNLTIVELPATITNFGANSSSYEDMGVFYKSSNLKAIVVPKSVVDSYKNGPIALYADKVTYASGLQVNLTDNNGEQSVYSEKVLVGSGFNNWRYTKGQWVSGSYALEELPELPNGWHWQYNGEPLTMDKIQDLYTKANTDGTITTIDAIAVREIDAPTQNQQTFIYNGAEQTYLPVGFDETIMEIKDNTRTDVGTQTVTVKLLGENMVFTGTNDKEITFQFTIAPADITVSRNGETVTLDNLDEFTISLERYVKVVGDNEFTILYKATAESDDYDLFEPPAIAAVAGEHKIYYQIMANNHNTLTGAWTVMVTEQPAVEPDDPNQGGDSGDNNGSDTTDPNNPDGGDNDGAENNGANGSETAEPQTMAWWEQATYIGLGVLSLILVAVFVFCMTKIAILERAYRKMVKQAMKH